jgi:DSBA-like thioredoxin domain
MKNFAVTWDYRCPFARNAHEHIVEALEAGAPWNVRFLPFSLGQAHVAEGAPDVWDHPHLDSGLAALSAGVAVRDGDPAHFLAVHRALFAARHDLDIDLRDHDNVLGVLDKAGADTTMAHDAIMSGQALETIRREHTEFVTSHNVWGVPTFIVDAQAVFVRFMHRPNGNAAMATTTIDRALNLLDECPDMNEFKHTSLPR